MLLEPVGKAPAMRKEPHVATKTIKTPERVLDTNDFAAIGYTVTELVALIRTLDESGRDNVRGYTHGRLIAALNRKHPISLDLPALPDAYDRANDVLFGKVGS